MTEAALRHEEQIAFWDGPGGLKWAAAQDNIDAMLAGVLPPLFDAAAPQPGEQAIDIGCGNGATTIGLAERVGPAGQVLAVDVSGPMVEVLRGRTAGIPQITCALGDAAVYAFPPAGADLAVSRFGVMFFGDPTAAFTHIRAALRPGGRLVFACWRPFPQNPWAFVPVEAATRHVEKPPRPGPEDPGPFSFGDPARVTRILTDAGFAAPDIRPLDLEIVLAASGGVAAAVVQVRMAGPASRAMQDQPEDLVAAALAEIAASLAPFERDGQVALPGAIWLVTTTNPG